jgi:hypothetical protein
MIYKIILGKNEIRISEDDRDKIVNNIGKSFIVLTSGEVVNPSFIQGIVIDHEAGRNETLESKNKKVVMIEGKPTLLE